MDYKNKILILGIGNYLMGDEGIGVQIANRLLEDDSLPDEVDVLDGGTGGFHLLEYFLMQAFAKMANFIEGYFQLKRRRANLSNRRYSINEKSENLVVIYEMNAK